MYGNWHAKDCTDRTLKIVAFIAAVRDFRTIFRVSYFKYLNALRKSKLDQLTEVNRYA